MGTKTACLIRCICDGKYLSLALDVAPDEAAGQTAMILGAVFGKEAIGKLDYVDIGLSLFDHPDGHLKFPHLWPPKLLQV